MIDCPARCPTPPCIRTSLTTFIPQNKIQAFLFNEGPGPRKVEIWEPITSITCTCGFRWLCLPGHVVR